MMEYKNLLVISNNFPDKYNKYSGNVFVKEQIMVLKRRWENIYVISPLAYGIEYLRNRHYENYSFDNVHVYFPKYYNFPLFYKYFQGFWIYCEKRAILKLIKNEGIKFDLIHAHFTWPSGAVAVEIKKELNLPLVITEHTSETFTDAIENKKNNFIKSWKLCNSIICVKKGDISRFNDVGIPLDKMHHIPNGYNHMTFLPLDTYACRNKLCLPSNKKIILNVGNLYSEAKGHKYIIDAMSEVVRNRTDVLCFIVGGGKLEHKLEKQIKSAGLQAYVKLVGGKPHDEIPIWMNACDLFVLPSLTESFGIVQIEAMACGKPIVATCNGGSEEIIISQDYGLLCKPADPEDLADKISIALDKKWNDVAIMKYAERFKWEKVAEEIIGVYSTIGRE